MLICLLSVCWHCNYIESDVTLNLGFVGLLFISSFPLPPQFIIKICHSLFFAFPLQKQWGLWRFREGVESQGFCFPLKPNTQKHFPAVCEDAAPSLCRSLGRSGMGGGNGTRTPLLPPPWPGKSCKTPFSLVSFHYMYLQREEKESKRALASRKSHICSLNAKCHDSLEKTQK